MPFSSRCISTLESLTNQPNKYFNFEKHKNNKQLSNKSVKNSTYNLNNYSFFKKPVTSGASRSTINVKTPLPIQPKLKVFFFSKKSNRGRSRLGILCRTKGKVLKKINYPYSCKSFRLLYLSFIAGIFTTPLKLKLYSLVISSSGSMLYVHSSYNHNLFTVSKLYSTFSKQYTSKKYSYLSKFIKIPQLFFLILQLPKHKFVSLLETLPGKGVQYVKSSGSKAIINKVDTKINLSLIKLPSGVRKVFSIYSVGSIGSTPFLNKNLKSSTNAGFNKKLGKKSLSRGVAKNPTDHPHGGRNKAIRYQRTP